MAIDQTKSYSQVVQLSSFQDRYEFLRKVQRIGEETFGCHRYLNQLFYQSKEWKTVRRKAILRDDGCDLAHPDYPIQGTIVIHHIEPITIEDILEKDPKIFDLENLICVSFLTHNALHYGDESLIPKPYVERCANDTCPWR